MKTLLHFFIFGIAMLLACQPTEPAMSSDSADPTTGTGETSTGAPTTPTTTPPTTSSPTTDTTTGPSTGSGTDGETELPETDSDDAGTDAPMCGDGILDDGEDCDDGMLANDGPCVDGCKHNVCGDGYVYAGVEMCDVGEQNGMYGGTCGAGCTTDNIPSCGDNILQDGYETCEVGETNGDGVSCNPEHCQWGDSRFIFVSSELLSGNLENDLIPNNMTGLARADALCQVLAVGAGLPGSYYAWLSDNNNTDGSDAAARIGGPQDGTDVLYVMPKGGVVLANGWGELVNEGPSVAITRTETGEELDSLSLPAPAWTNTGMQGTSLNEDSCDNWTSNSGFGWSGLTTTGSAWTNYDVYLCANKKAHIYCFQGQEK